jgi:hypothetical protein
MILKACDITVPVKNQDPPAKRIGKAQREITLSYLLAENQSESPNLL